MLTRLLPGHGFIQKENRSETTRMRKNSLKKIGLSIMAALSALTMSVPAQSQTLLRDTEIEDWIRDYSDPIFRAAKLDPESIEILLIGDQTPNAFAGGRIMGIFTGLITTADTPNQVEGVIAHEAGHMAGGHGPRRAEAYARASRPILLSLVLAAGAIAAGAPEAGIGLLGLGQQIGTVNALAYTRGQEASADQAAISYLNSVGHSSRGLVEFFGKLRNTQVLRSRRINPYYQTHPLAGVRMAALTERVEASEYKTVQDSAADIARMRLIQAKIKGFLQQPRFTLREYPLTDQSAPARYARAVAFYRGTDLPRALKEIDSLLDEYPTNPFFQELKGQMLFEFGQSIEAIEPHRRSVELAPTSALLRVNLGRALLGTETDSNMREAVDVLKSALVLEPDNSFGWFELARAYGYLNEEAYAMLATAESRYHSGAKPDAAQFARRAIREFERGSPEWHQAQDIIVAVTNETKRRGARGRGGQGERGGRGPGGSRRRGGDRPDQERPSEENDSEEKPAPPKEVPEDDIPDEIPDEIPFQPDMPWNGHTSHLSFKIDGTRVDEQK